MIIFVCVYITKARQIIFVALLIIYINLEFSEYTRIVRLKQETPCLRKKVTLKDNFFGLFNRPDDFFVLQTTLNQYKNHFKFASK